MSTTKFTPGPWGFRAAYSKPQYEIRPAAPADGYTVGYAPLAVVAGDKRLVDDQSREANARLMAAAPELLEAVEIAIRALQQWPMNQGRVLNALVCRDYLLGVANLAQGGSENWAFDLLRRRARAFAAETRVYTYVDLPRVTKCQVGYRCADGSVIPHRTYPIPHDQIVWC